MNTAVIKFMFVISAFIAALFLAGCGSEDCSDLADKICECPNLPQEMCDEAKKHAEDANEDDTGKRNQECGDVASDFSCDAPSFITYD